MDIPIAHDHELSAFCLRNERSINLDERGKDGVNIIRGAERIWNNSDIRVEFAGEIANETPVEP